MILLEYIVGQCQSGTTSVALLSKRQKRQNPAVSIISSNGLFIWRFDGLNIGNVEDISGDPRANRIDFYIGLEDLVPQIHLIPTTRARSLGLVDGLRIPVGSERRGGKNIRWRGPVSRVPIAEIDLRIPPFKLLADSNNPIVLNIDRETSPYPIDNGNGQTTLELHFGIEHPFIIKSDSRINIPRFQFSVTNNQHATILEAINNSSTIYTTYFKQN